MKLQHQQLKRFPIAQLCYKRNFVATIGDLLMHIGGFYQNAVQNSVTGFTSFLRPALRNFYINIIKTCLVYF